MRPRHAIDTLDARAAEAARWAQFARRNRLPRAVARALVTAVRNGADADSFARSRGEVHVFVHLPGQGLVDAVLVELLRDAGFAYDPESGDWRWAKLTAV